MDASPRRVVGRWHRPTYAAHSQVAYGTDDPTHIQTARSSARFGRWYLTLDIESLAVGQINRVLFWTYKTNMYQELANSLDFSNGLESGFVVMPAMNPRR